MRKLDVKGNVIYEKFENGKEYFYKYDQKGNNIFIKGSDNYERICKYDEKGNRIFIKETINNKLLFYVEKLYNDKNQLIFIKNKDSATTYCYDVMGRILSENKIYFYENN